MVLLNIADQKTLKEQKGNWMVLNSMGREQQLKSAKEPNPENQLLEDTWVGKDPHLQDIDTEEIIQDLQVTHIADTDTKKGERNIDQDPDHHMKGIAGEEVTHAHQNAKEVSPILHADE